MNKKLLLFWCFFIFSSNADETTGLEDSLENLKSGEIQWFVFEKEDKEKNNKFIQCSNEVKYIVCNFPAKLFLPSSLPQHLYKTKHNPDNKLINVLGAKEQINIDDETIISIKSLAKDNSLLIKDFYYKAYDINSNLVGSGLDIDIAMKINGDKKNMYNFLIRDLSITQNRMR